MEERTEKPTPRRLKKARKQGDVPISLEFSASISLLGALLLLWGLASLLTEGFQASFFEVYDHLSDPEIYGALKHAFQPLLFPISLILAGIFFLVILSYLLQRGWLWSSKHSKSKPELRWIFLIFKLFVISIIGYFSLYDRSFLAQLVCAPYSEKIDLVFKKVFFLLLNIAIGLLFLGLWDFFYQKWKYDKKMRMTPQELKDEKRETEGNQQTKSQMREKNR